MASIEAELGDIQGNILRAYGFGFARYEVICILDQQGARRLLQSVLDQELIMSAAAWDPAAKPVTALNVFFSWSGLKALGVPHTSLESFPEEFREGMAVRAALLGDTGPDAPGGWDFGKDPDRNHIFFALYGRTAGDRDRMLQKLRDELAAVGPAVEVTHRLDAAMLSTQREHFGFADGFGQPSIQGSGAPEFRGDGTPLAEEGWAPIASGEFVLGWPGETGFKVAMPQPETFGRNGSFLVYRKIQQHVPAFRAFLTAQAERLYGDARPCTIERVAAKLVGRWPNGCPLMLSPKTDRDEPGLEVDWDRINDFRYERDSQGVVCPLGSHIRRMNPRDGLTGDGLVRTHRIVRRGLPYGSELADGATDDEDRGVAFMAINASIKHQFEFLQTEWINSGEFAGLSRSDVDPISGQPRAGSRFRIPTDQGAPKNIFDLARFVTLRGGGYYFIPSLTAMRSIAAQAWS